MPTKSASGDALLHISDTINYKLGLDLNVEKEKEIRVNFESKILKLAAFMGIHLWVQKVPIISF